MDAARAIVINNGKYLVMERNKYGKKYLTLVGGRLEVGETPQKAVIREVFEETGLVVISPRLVFVEAPLENYGKQYIYLCEYTSGEPLLPENSEEFAAAKSGEDTYLPRWAELTELRQNFIPFMSEKLRTELLNCYPDNFPSEPITWQP